MPTTTESGVIVFIGTDAAANPAATATGNRLYPGTWSTLAEAETYLRANPSAPYRTIGVDNIANITVTVTSGGGGGGGGTTAGITPLMDTIRARYRAPAAQVDVAFTGTGEWEYKVARTAEVNFEQLPPDWSAIAWQDAPSGSGERVISTANHVNKTVQVLMRSKTRPTEMYDVPIKSNAGSTNGFGWVTYGRPSANVINTSAAAIMPGRSWRERLTVTVEPGPSSNMVNLRMVSGFARAANTRWFWNVDGVPLFANADQDNFVYPVAKGIMATVTRIEAKTTGFFNQYGQAETIVTEQWTSNLFDVQNFNEQDRVMIWTGI